jgi:hypothetical protein
MWSPGLISDRSTRFESSPIPAAAAASSSSQRAASTLQSRPRRLYSRPTTSLPHLVHGREQAGGAGGWCHGEWLRVGERALYIGKPDEGEASVWCLGREGDGQVREKKRMSRVTAYKAGTTPTHHRQLLPPPPPASGSRRGQTG